MKYNTKSSITLPPEELELVKGLMIRLGAKSKVEVVRRGLHLLKETTDRKALKKAFAEASIATRSALKSELTELDHLADEGMD